MRILVDTNILISAILFPKSLVEKVDIILTGDKDFLSFDMEHPCYMNVTQFLELEDVEL